MKTIIDKLKGMLVGLAAGDAVGTTVEFEARGTFDPVTDMTGGGPFNLVKGQWTDDTSMALCLAESLIEKQGFDALDQMQRYTAWHSTGHLSSTGRCFDIGITISVALSRFCVSGDPYSGSKDPHSAGNGSIMRLAPIVMAYYKNERLLEFAANSSRTTHACEEAIESSKLFASQLRMAVITDCDNDMAKDNILLKHGYQSKSPKVSDVANGNYLTKTYEQLTGSGYVIESLESALWCFYNSSSFKEAILKATNLGNDADTTAAICGQIAGAYYGYAAIPESWRKALAKRELIEDYADKLSEFSTSN